MLLSELLLLLLDMLELPVPDIEPVASEDVVPDWLLAPLRIVEPDEPLPVLLFVLVLPFMPVLLFVPVLLLVLLPAAVLLVVLLPMALAGPLPVVPWPLPVDCATAIPAAMDRQAALTAATRFIELFIAVAPGFIK